MFAKDYREIARKALKGKWRNALPVFLIYTLIINGFGLTEIWQKYFSVERTLGSAGADAPFVYLMPAGVGWLLLALVLALTVLGWIVRVGLYRANGSLLDGESPSVRQLFPWDLTGRAILLGFFHALLAWLEQLLLMLAQWASQDRMLLSLLLLAMSIALLVWALCYSMAEFIMANEPGTGPIQALRQSRIRMRGRKWKFFCLGMSFFGWILLLSIAGAIFVALLPEVLENYVLILLAAPLELYMQLSYTSFLRGDTKPEEEGSRFIRYDGGDSAPDQAPEDASDRRVTALTAGETLARDVFVRHGCSRNRMRKEGVLEAYEKLNVDPSFEPRWLREYASGLMLRFDREPAALDEILDLSAEYAMEDLLTRALERIERHIRQETLPAGEILDMAGRVLALAVSGKFADHPDFVRRRRAQVSDMADRLEHRLREKQGDGSWQRALELIRQMCE